MEFYIMRPSYNNYAMAIELESPKKIIRCEKCGSIESILIDKLKVCMKGEKVGDYYGATFDIISGRLQQLLKNENIDGYELRDVDIEDWVDNGYNSIDIDYSDLKAIIPKSSCGCLRHKDGRIIEKCQACGTMIYKKRKEVEGLGIDLEVWDKSDIFCYDNWKGNLIVTERLKKLIEKGKYKNIQFINIKDFRFS
ncbi:hypothetical protein [Clostridium sp. C8-1-8]|uniref:hypothetical protein n=1 Tax=Clostridium sp. C8-1-8 TaxID=2698831 RepID=UPI0013680BF0|nr:hypothetical protein [Clostridium sp. C8-1-8]